MARYRRVLFVVPPLSSARLIGRITIPRPFLYLLNETALDSQVIRMSPTSTSFYLHVDDGCVIRDGGGNSADSLMHTCADALEELGFEVSDRQENAKLDKIVGYETCRSPARLLIPKGKMWLLYAALRHLTLQHRVDTRTLWSLTGVWVWTALLRREVLCIPHLLFKLLDFGNDQVIAWWPSVRKEVTSMAAILPLI